METPALLGFRHRRVQRLRRLVRRASARRDERAMVLEGAKLVSEALRGGQVIESLFVGPGAPADVVAEVAATGARIDHVDAGVLERVADTVTPQPLIAIAPWCDRPLADVVDATLVVVAVDVRDPGNAGTLLRSAEAAGADAVIACEGSVDLFNPKCVRASAGSLFHVPVVRGRAAPDVLDALRSSGLRVLITDARDGVPYDQADLVPPTALVFGNEAHGLPAAAIERADGSVTIPIEGRSESLNVGVAAAVLCFEATRQRRAATAARGVA